METRNKLLDKVKNSKTLWSYDDGFKNSGNNSYSSKNKSNNNYELMD